jgi:hypothetical protein
MRRMSALGHKRKSRCDFLMSALTPTADIRAQRTIGRKVPIADTTTVIIGTGKNYPRLGKPTQLSMEFSDDEDTGKGL